MTLRNLTKTLLLRIGKATGLFSISRWITRGELRVLCYHGFAMADEAEFLPDLFVTEDFFKRRLRWISENGYKVLDLDQAMTLREQQKLPKYATVITIDDGFYSAYAIAMGALSAHDFPATLYVSSYYVQKGTPILGLLLQYIAWKGSFSGPLAELLNALPELRGYKPEISGALDLRQVASKLQEYSEENYGADEQQRVAMRFAELLGIDYEEILRSRILGLVNSSEIKELDSSGVRIELHTHRHRFPTDKGHAKEEIERNRSVLEPILNRSTCHFCYPSGDWSKLHWQVLEEVGIRSATTCDREFARRNDSRYSIPRILDDSRISALEFEAEMSGFLVLLRRSRLALGL